LDAACRKHYLVYLHSNVLAEWYEANNILAVKARKRITARDSTLGERAAAAAVWASKAKTKIGFENEKEENEQANTSGSKTQRHSANSVVVRSSRFGWLAERQES